MDKTPPPAEYAALVESLLAGHPELTSGSIFGVPCVKRGGKPFISSYAGGAVFKLSGEAHQTALGLPGAALFDPSGRGRPMRAWVLVPVRECEQWPRLADAALSSEARA